mgnify:CR=1 FL=1
MTKQLGLLEEPGFRVFLKDIGRTVKVGEFSGEATPVRRPDNGLVTVQVDRPAESRRCDTTILSRGTITKEEDLILGPRACCAREDVGRSRVLVLLGRLWASYEKVLTSYGNRVAEFSPVPSFYWLNNLAAPPAVLISPKGQDGTRSRRRGRPRQPGLSNLVARHFIVVPL